VDECKPLCGGRRRRRWTALPRTRSSNSSRTWRTARQRRGGALRVTRYDPISMWEIGHQWEYQYGIWVIDMEYGVSIWSSTISIWSSWISMWDMGDDMGHDIIDMVILHIDMGYLVTLRSTAPRHLVPFPPPLQPSQLHNSKVLTSWRKGDLGVMEGPGRRRRGGGSWTTTSAAASAAGTG
jgi:hypothetical protein